MTLTASDIPQLEIALRDLTKLIKAVQYYPAAHPALQAAVAGNRQSLDPLLRSGDSLICNVRKEGFFSDDKPVGAQNQILQKLAPYLFARRVQSLVFLPDLLDADLLGFAQALALDPTEIRKRGGIKEALLQHQVTTIWANETDLSRILQERAQAEARIAEEQQLAQNGMEEALIDPADQNSLDQVLAALRQPQQEQDYRQLQQELVPLARLHATPEGCGKLLEALALLCQHVSDRQRDKSQREIANQSLTLLTDPPTIELLINFLCAKDLADNNRKLLLKVFAFLHNRTARLLMDRLTVEDNAHHRRLLMDALVAQKRNILPIMAEYLRDERWYVVRNAVTIIGEVREPESARLLPPLLHHEDIRVCREAIRALTRIGGRGAVQILIDAVQDKEEEISRQALLSLGAIKDSAAIPTLQRILEQGDFFLKRLGKKRDAIQTLGEIGAPEAAPALIQLLASRRLFKRRQHDSLRAAAAQALAEINHPQVQPALEKAADDPSPDVARQATSALKIHNRLLQKNGHPSS